MGKMSLWGDTRWTALDAIDGVNIDSDNDTAEYGFVEPGWVTRIAFIPTTAVANAAGTVDVEIYRNNDFGDSGEDTLLGTIQVIATTTLAVGEVMVANLWGQDTDGEVAEDSTTRYVGGLGPYSIGWGEGLVLKVVEPADSGALRVSIEYMPQGAASAAASGNLARIYNVPTTA